MKSKKLTKAERRRIKRLTEEARKVITLAAGDPSSASAFWPTSPTSAPAGRVPPGLPTDALALHSTIAGKAARDGTHYFEAMAALTGNDSYRRLSDIPPVQPIDQTGIMTGIDPAAARQYAVARAMAVAQGIGWMDALQVLDDARELRELEADDGSASADWLDSTVRPDPPRPWSTEDWERDQRRAAAAGVDVDREAWLAGAERGEDLVGQVAEHQRQDRIATLKQRTAGGLSQARTREDERRAAALADELTSRARQRTQEAAQAARRTPDGV
jgi:hypothetical protein